MKKISKFCPKSDLSIDNVANFYYFQIPIEKIVLMKLIDIINIEKALLYLKQDMVKFPIQIAYALNENLKKCSSITTIFFDKQKMLMSKYMKNIIGEGDIVASREDLTKYQEEYNNMLNTSFNDIPFIMINIKDILNVSDVECSMDIFDLLEPILKK